ncbi:ricin-type beta-trefoil lectin domain protein [Streptomyces sp. TLI_171]|uniref:ricin-type beta-trefoil lectin domain protein n=1 Tax=Streptomyces sp. TLI_171 TaxID=1938859 RepID=UPI000C599107|nr:ricin-type beta-trefoil lectin domain protein [Streptomyces sp. TLI_171]RKE23626.1 O-glycosyl hydrolase [Streptomyces sp. TLI_171]
MNGSFRILAMPGRALRRAASAAALLLPAALLVGPAAAPASAATVSTSITVDGARTGRVFDGVGAASGGGGNSRLLIDYPEPQRSQLLDYLFKPGYGAALQTLKIEIGGDTNSTDGAEPSYQHSRGAVDCNQGYEWWLAEQAKARNPDIKLYGLAWGAPGWIGVNDAANPSPGTPYFWSQDMIDYLMGWIGCAAQHHLPIDYLGGWNERDYNATWYKNLKSALTANGHGSTKVVGADSWDWKLADAMAADPALDNAIDVIGMHYPCGYLGAMTTCNSTPSAQAIGKPLWASESGSQDYNTGAAAVARAINRDYIDGRMTSFINWPAIAALYQNLYFSTDGMSLAPQPWSGSYSIGQTTWVTAHTTQFTKPGWKYLDPAAGYLGGNRTNGSYVALRSPSTGDYSAVVETMDATASQTAAFTITGGLSTGQVHVWSTNLATADASDDLVHEQDLTPVNGSYTLTLQPGHLYTVTTTTGQGKGAATAPAAAPLGLPYADGFDTPAATGSPRYFADMNGAFQTGPCAGGRTGSCLRQMAPTAPIHWTDEPNKAPYTIVGDLGWANYTAAADTLFAQPGAAEVLGRVNQQGRNDGGLNAYHLRLSDTGSWAILKSDLAWSLTTLASGTVTAPGLNTWHRLSLTMQGSTLTAAIDGKTVGTATDHSYTSGMAGLALTGYRTQQFDNLALTPGTGTGPITGPVASGVSGKCLDAYGNSSADGTKAVIWTCATSDQAQAWTWDNGRLLHGGKCLDVVGQGTAVGTLVDLWTCNGGANQQWNAQADGTLKSLQSGLCLDDPSASTTDGTQLVVWTCKGSANQKWTLP